MRVKRGLYARGELLVCLFLFGLLVYGISEFGAGGRGNSGVARVIEFEPDQIDFGNRLEGEPAERRVRIENRGDRTSVLTLHSTCTCSVIGQTRVVLGPGEGEDVAVSMHTNGVRGGRAAVIQAVDSEHNDVAQCRVSVNVVPRVVVEPETIRIGADSDGAECQLWFIGRVPPDEIKAVSRTEGTYAQSTQVNGRSWRIRIERASAGGGNVEGRVEIMDASGSVLKSVPVLVESKRHLQWRCWVPGTREAGRGSFDVVILLEGATGTEFCLDHVSIDGRAVDVDRVSTANDPFAQDALWVRIGGCVKGDATVKLHLTDKGAEGVDLVIPLSGPAGG